ncbi:protein of unknown function [Azospirillum lipoferum 4B]|uniref:Uncharacterized protein n=1 Tax=Azospirillum lipoferum (strain 4B) TaxID=862719 RepID=G7Z9P5_AZOL4|nr:protein of unknown function [Azospirillum lipoferum 4B]
MSRMGWTPCRPGYSSGARAYATRVFLESPQTCLHSVHSRTRGRATHRGFGPSAAPGMHDQ